MFVVQVNEPFAGHTALQTACLNGHRDAVATLIARDADLEIEVSNKYYQPRNIKMGLETQR